MVKVPVLSKHTILAFEASSRYLPPLIKIFFFAAALIAALIAVEADRIVAQGQAITSITEKARHIL